MAKFKYIIILGPLVLGFSILLLYGCIYQIIMIHIFGLPKETAIDNNPSYWVIGWFAIALMILGIIIIGIAGVLMESSSPPVAHDGPYYYRRTSLPNSSRTKEPGQEG